MHNPEISVPELPSFDIKTPLYRAVIVFCVVLCLTPLLQTLAPRILGFLPALAGLVFVAALRILNGRWPPQNRLYITLALATGSLAAFSSLWSIDPGFALERALKIAALLCGGYALFTALRLNIAWPRFLYGAFPLALLGAGVLCAVELWSHGLLYRIWRDVDISSYNPSVANRAVVSFALLLLPTLGFLRLSSCGLVQKRLLQCAFLAVSIAIALTTQSQSAHMVLIVAGLFWLAFPVFSNSKTAQLALITSVSLGIILSPWLVQLLYSGLAGEVHTLPWFADAYAADRLEIWDFVARKALENPLYGFGLEATRHIKHFDTAMLYTPLDHVLHPHNAVLQIWIEFGAIGALGLCAAVTAILRHIFKLDKQAGPVCLAAFMAGFVAACISYGLWQGWWLGLFSLLAALCGHLARNSKKTAS